MMRSQLSATAYVIDSTVTDHHAVLLNLTYNRKHPLDFFKQFIKIDYDAVIKRMVTVDFSFISPMVDVHLAASIFDEHYKTLF